MAMAEALSFGAHGKAPSPGSQERSDLSSKGEVVAGQDRAGANLSLWGRGRRAAAGEWAFLDLAGDVA